MRIAGLVCIVSIGILQSRGAMTPVLRTYAWYAFLASVFVVAILVFINRRANPNPISWGAAFNQSMESERAKQRAQAAANPMMAKLSYVASVVVVELICWFFASGLILKLFDFAQIRGRKPLAVAAVCGILIAIPILRWLRPILKRNRGL